MISYNYTPILFVPCSPYSGGTPLTAVIHPLMGYMVNYDRDIPNTYINNKHISDNTKVNFIVNKDKSNET